MVTRSRTGQVAVRIAQEATLLIRTTARPRRVLRLKSSAYDVLTTTDLLVEGHVRRRLTAAFPDHRVIGEEADGSAEIDLAARTWFVDPVDGTTNYFHGLPLVACNLALWDGQGLRCGVTADVMRQRTFWAERDRGAWLGRTRLTVSATRDLASAVVSTGFPYDRSSVADNNLAEFAAVVPLVRDVRRLGCAGLDMAFVAAGCRCS